MALVWRSSRRKAPGAVGCHTHTAPNMGLELTAYSVRCAPASSRSSGLAFGNDSPEGK